MRWTLRKKLILSFLAVAFLTAVSGFFGMFNIAKIGDALSIVAEREAPIVTASLKMRVAVQEGEKALTTYRSVTATVPTAREGASLDEIEKRYEAVLAHFNALGKAIREGGTVDGRRIIASDNDKLRRLVQEVEEIRNTEFQPRAKKLTMLGKSLVEGKKRVEASLVSMTNAYTNAVEAEAVANTALKEWIRDTHLAKDSMVGKVACSACHSASDSGSGGNSKVLPMSDVAETQLLALGEGRVSMAEAARLVDPAKLADMEKRFQASASDFMIYTNSLLKGGQTPKGNTRQVTDSKVRRLIEKVVPPYRNFESAGMELLKEQRSLIAAKLEAERITSELEESAHKIDGKLSEILTLSRNGMDTARDAASKANSSANITLILTIIVSALISIGLGIVVSGRISGNILRIGHELEESANQVAMASGEISSGSQDLAAGATQQASNLEETSASLEEMAAMTCQNTGNAEQANLLARQASTDAVHGQNTMRDMTGAMAQINASSEKIAGIIKVIDDIAFQTNLLALNAAVEAARAGEHGKGFAVVAEEVRNLAQRSSIAAKDTAQLIEESVGRTRQGTDLSGKCAEALEKIVAGANKVVDLLSEIAAASKEQSDGIGQVNQAMGQMDQIMQRNAASAEESAAASEELSAQSEGMRERVAELVALVEGARANGSKVERPAEILPAPAAAAHDILLRVATT